MTQLCFVCVSIFGGIEWVVLDRRCCCNKENLLSEGGGGEEAMLGFNGFCRLWSKRFLHRSLQHTDILSPSYPVHVQCYHVFYFHIEAHDDSRSLRKPLWVAFWGRELIRNLLSCWSRGRSSWLGQHRVRRTKAMGFIGDAVLHAADQRVVCTALSSFPVR